MRSCNWGFPGLTDLGLTLICDVMSALSLSAEHAALIREW